MTDINKILKQYHKTEDAISHAESEAQILSCLVSEALGKEITADICDGNEIEFRIEDEDYSTIVIDDIIKELKNR